MKVKEESEKVGLKLNIQKTKIMASGPITSWQIDGETGLLSTMFAWCPYSSDLQAASILTGLCSHCFDRFYWMQFQSYKTYGNLVHAKCCISIQWLRMIYFTYIVDKHLTIYMVE